MAAKLTLFWSVLAQKLEIIKHQAVVSMQISLSLGIDNVIDQKGGGFLLLLLFQNFIHYET